jgi:hypothetical protein
MIESVAGPVVVTTHALWGQPAITVGGQAAPRVGKRQYALPATAGGTVAATVRNGLADPFPTLEINGIRHRTGPKVPVVLQILSVLPIVLVAVGGLVGGLIGGLGFVVNLSVARTSQPAVVKALLMVGVAVTALAVLLLIAAAIRP